MIIVSRSSFPVRKRSRIEAGEQLVAGVVHHPRRHPLGDRRRHHEAVADEAGHLEHVREARGAPEDRVVVRRDVVAAGPLPQDLDLPRAGESAR